MFKLSQAEQKVKKSKHLGSVEAHAWNPRSWEVEPRGSEIQDQPQLHNKSKINLGSTKPYLKKSKKKKKGLEKCQGKASSAKCDDLSSMFHPCNPHGGKGEVTSTGCPLVPTCAPWSVHHGVHIHTNKYETATRAKKEALKWRHGKQQFFQLWIFVYLIHQLSTFWHSIMMSTHHLKLVLGSSLPECNQHSHNLGPHIHH